MADRLYVRDCLTEIMEDQAVACVIKECMLCCPFVQGLEFVDTPGTGSDDPMQWKQLTSALTSANGIMVVMQRNLSANKELKRSLCTSGLVSKLLQAPARCPLILFSALGEIKEPCTAETLLKEGKKLKRDRDEGECCCLRRFFPALRVAARALLCSRVPCVAAPGADRA